MGTEIKTLRVRADSTPVLEALSSPLRVRLLDLLHGRTLSVKEIADALEVPRTRLYHHLHLLEGHGLVRVAETRTVSGLEEKRYTAPYAAFFLEQDAFFGDDRDAATGLEALFAMVFERAKADIRQGVASRRLDMQLTAPEPGALMMRYAHLRLGPTRAREFYARLAKLAEDFAEFDDEDGGWYSLSLALYPSHGPGGPNT